MTEILLKVTLNTITQTSKQLSIDYKKKLTLYCQIYTRGHLY